MLTIPNIEGLHFGVFGLGRTGKATLDCLQSNGAVCVAFDDDEATCQLFKEQGYTILPYDRWDWTRIAELILSPGIPDHYPKAHPVAELAKHHKVPIITDIDLLMRAHLDAMMIGITGTNGKSTTTALLGYCLAQAGEKPVVAGNIGTSPLASVWAGSSLYGVLELSSFQLERMRHNRLNAAILLNITPDHMDRHATFEDYVKAKSRIFDSSDLKVAVIGVDEDVMQTLYQELQNKPIDVIPISVKKALSNGIYVEDGYLVDHYWGYGRVIDLDRCTFLKGMHNAQNMAACYALAKYIGIDTDVIIGAFQSFRGLPHRSEWVGRVRNVDFINDSKATNVESACKALSSYDNIYWIVGGKYKGEPLEPLEPYLGQVKRIYAIGSSGPVFNAFFKNKKSIHLCETLDQALNAAVFDAQKSSESAVILLSPACASFDQFKNFEHRGDVFKALCQAITTELGDVNRMKFEEGHG